MQRRTLYGILILVALLGVVYFSQLSELPKVYVYRHRLVFYRASDLNIDRIDSVIPVHYRFRNPDGTVVGDVAYYGAVSTSDGRHYAVYIGRGTTSIYTSGGFDGVVGSSPAGDGNIYLYVTRCHNPTCDIYLVKVRPGWKDIPSEGAELLFSYDYRPFYVTQFPNGWYVIYPVGVDEDGIYVGKLIRWDKHVITGFVAPYAALYYDENYNDLFYATEPGRPSVSRTSYVFFESLSYGYRGQVDFYPLTDRNYFIAGIGKHGSTVYGFAIGYYPSDDYYRVVVKPIWGSGTAVDKTFSGFPEPVRLDGVVYNDPYFYIFVEYQDGLHIYRFRYDGSEPLQEVQIISPFRPIKPGVDRILVMPFTEDNSAVIGLIRDRGNGYYDVDFDHVYLSSEVPVINLAEANITYWNEENIGFHLRLCGQSPDERNVYVYMYFYPRPYIEMNMFRYLLPVTVGTDYSCQDINISAPNPYGFEYNATYNVRIYVDDYAPFDVNGQYYYSFSGVRPSDYPLQPPSQGGETGEAGDRIR